MSKPKNSVFLLQCNGNNKAMVLFHDWTWSVDGCGCAWCHGYRSCMPKLSLSFQRS